MSKKILLYSIAIVLSLVLENFLLTIILAQYDGLGLEVRYLLKSLILAVTFYCLLHRRHKLTIPLKNQLGWLDTVSVNSLSFFYVILVSTPALAYGFLFHLDTLPYALIVSLCAAFFEEYFFRGLLVSLLLKDKPITYKKVLYSAVVSSLLFGLAHIGNLQTQSLSETGNQMFYATVIGVYFVAIVLRTRSLWWTIFIHFMIDFGSIMYTASSQSTVTLTPMAVFLYLVILLFAFYVMRPGCIDSDKL